MNKDIQLSVETSYISSRLDNYLAAQFSDYSRSYFQGIIVDGVVKVNGSPIKKASRILKENDEVTFAFPAPKKYSVLPQKVDFDVVDIQDDFLVINKPAGLIVHPADKKTSGDPSLVAGLLHDFEEFEEFDESQRPGIAVK